MIRAVDLDNDGRVDFEDFCKLMEELVKRAAVS